MPSSPLAPRALLALLAPLALCAPAGCGGGGGTDYPDAGACREPLSVPWPSAADLRVCVRDPAQTEPAARTLCGEVWESCADDGVTTPVLDCLTSGDNPPSTPETVTLTGYADVFSSGPSSTGNRLEIYRATDVPDTVTDLGQVTPIATLDLTLDQTTLATARACPKSLTEPSDLKGSCVQPDTNCGGGCDRDLQATDFCHNGNCYGLQRWEIRYEVAGLPTNTFLVLRTIGLTAGQPDPGNDTWAPIVQYNVFLSTAARACADAEDENCLDAGAGRYQMKLNLLSRSDYRSIPQTAGLSSGIAPGNGGIAGEVHDCEDIRVEHAQVGFFPLPARAVYFNGNPIKTLPDPAQPPHGTDRLGLYAGLEMPPGPVMVEAVGMVGGEAATLGRFRARIWPDSITIVGVNGGKPPQP